MSIWELLLVAVALSMDAFAVGMTNGMTNSKMKIGKVLLIAAFYGGFQFLMPVIGYFASGVFSSLIEKVAPWVSFILLGFIGGKMIYDGVKEVLEHRKEEKEAKSATHARGEEEKGMETVEKPLSIKTLSLQALATSIDALAVGVSFLALSTDGTLCLNVWWDSLIIGCVTFSLSIIAVYLGKVIGNKLADKAEIAGGAVLVIIGIKILIEGLL
jgi:putative Mn2+ efflux pump MntP